MSKRGAADEEGPEIPAETDFLEFFEPWPRVQAAPPHKRLKVCVFRPKHGNDCIILRQHDEEGDQESLGRPLARPKLRKPAGVGSGGNCVAMFVKEAVRFQGALGARCEGCKGRCCHGVLATTAAALSSALLATGVAKRLDALRCYDQIFAPGLESDLALFAALSSRADQRIAIYIMALLQKQIARPAQSGAAAQSQSHSGLTAQSHSGLTARSHSGLTAQSHSGLTAQHIAAV